MRPVILRLLVCGLLACGWIPDAMAQLPILRGSNVYQVSAPTFRNWNGFYVGGQAGLPTSAISFSSGVSGLIADILRVTTVASEFSPSTWASLSKRDTTRRSYGGFVGYNAQFGETVLGLEANYNRTTLQVQSGNTISRQVTTSDGYLNQVTVSGTGDVTLTDYGTIRARAAWVYNSIMPYGFVGFAVGRASVTKTASVVLIGTDADPLNPPVLPDVNFADAITQGQTNAFSYGWTVGLGVDWALLSNVFLRGEYEYVSFPNFRGVNIAINNVQVAAGFRF